MATLWTGSRSLILASTSPTRQALLTSAHLPFEARAPGVDERAVERHASAQALDPMGLASELAAAKALAVSKRYPDRLVLGADQVLVCDDTIFHKPGNRDAAHRQLQRLAGKTHLLHSAGILARNSRVIDTFADTAHLTMRPLSDEAIRHYLMLSGDTVLGSVGAYHVEGFGIHLFERIEGDHSTILGLPLVPLLAALRRLGCLAF